MFVFVLCEIQFKRLPLLSQFWLFEEGNFLYGSLGGKWIISGQQVRSEFTFSSLPSLFSSEKERKFAPFLRGLVGRTMEKGKVEHQQGNGGIWSMPNYAIICSRPKPVYLIIPMPNILLATFLQIALSAALFNQDKSTMGKSNFCLILKN